MHELIDSLIKERTLRTGDIISAFRGVDRKMFVRPEDAAKAYEDYPLPIGYGQTISQPTTVAFMLELLQPKRGEKVLDVGAGSGWTTALLAHIVGPTGKVLGVELVPELITFGQTNLKRAQVTNATIQLAGTTPGLPELASYDRILVSAAAQKLPQPLVDQLRPGGVMVLPVGSAVWCVQKNKHAHLDIDKFEGFVFVPFIE